MKIFYFLCLLITAFAQTTQDWQTELREIDQQITELKERQRLYKSQILRLEDNAERWQSDPGRLADARRAWQIADEKREKIVQAQDEIDALQARKEAILKEHPEYHSSS